LEYLKNKAKSGDMAVLEFKFRNVSLGKWSKIDPATGITGLLRTNAIVTKRCLLAERTGLGNPVSLNNYT